MTQPSAQGAQQVQKRHVIAAAEAHTNLTTWGAVIALLEGGLLYGRTTPVAGRVIDIAKREQSKYLKALDAAVAKATGATP